MMGSAVGVQCCTAENRMVSNNEALIARKHRSRTLYRENSIELVNAGFLHLNFLNKFWVLQKATPSKKHVISGKQSSGSLAMDTQFGSSLLNLSSA